MHSPVKGDTRNRDPRYYSMLVAEADRIVKKSNVILWVKSILWIDNRYSQESKFKRFRCNENDIVIFCNIKDSNISNS